MKKFYIFILLVFTCLVKTNALSYSEARSRAWYLTDKMAYELNLTEEQYDRAYEINLDYFLSVRSSRDIEGAYWRYRNDDFIHILYDWQYEMFSGTAYFFRPLMRVRGAWVLTSYSYYDRNFYYFNRPVIYNVYLGRNWRRTSRPNVNPYHDYRITGSYGMRDRYVNGRNHGGSPTLHSNGGRINRSNNKRYDYEWRNPGVTHSNNLRDNGHNGNNNRHEQSASGNGNNFRHDGNNSNRGDRVQSNENSNEVHFGNGTNGTNRRQHATSGNNYRNNRTEQNVTENNTNRPVMQPVRTENESTQQTTERRHSRNNVFGSHRDNRRENIMHSNNQSTNSSDVNYTPSRVNNSEPRTNVDRPRTNNSQTRVNNSQTRVNSGQPRVNNSEIRMNNNRPTVNNSQRRERSSVQHSTPVRRTTSDRVVTRTTTDRDNTSGRSTRSYRR